MVKAVQQWPTTVTPNSCRVKVDSAAASNISASLSEKLCPRRNPPINYPSDESAAQKLLVGGVACLMAVSGSWVEELGEIDTSFV